MPNSWSKSPREFEGTSLVRGRMTTRGSYGGRGRGGSKPNTRFTHAPPPIDNCESIITIPNMQSIFRAGRVKCCVYFFLTFNLVRSGGSLILYLATDFPCPFSRHGYDTWTYLSKSSTIQVARFFLVLPRLFVGSKKSGCFRPVIKLKPLNEFLLIENFNMERITLRWNQE